MTKTPAPFTPIVRRRLRRVRDFILAHPSKFGMEVLFAKSRAAMKRYNSLDEVPSRFTLSTGCGTTCCIAGWYHAVTPKKERLSWPTNTLSVALGGWASHVYNADQWPEPFRTDFDNAKSARAEARVAARRIDYLLETGR